MSHRRIIRTSTGLGVLDTATAQTIAIFPNAPAGSAEQHARHFKYLPEILDHLRHRSFHNDQEAQRLLEKIEPAPSLLGPSWRG